ncbi:coiled-coil domain-containing protein 117 [Mus musculus]|uniref:Coiled-coil domain-containing protein 117 n=1 Tax=Mus musculus TaxID=10090 RepID=CC117_MOUSE|nr:coiled-coil domain-containing protein 117 [Mus musculus]Q6PB51.1 RecName: Full=Coiled-coil domain-containing protein 117 [Mus musculus]AAH59888.1 Coiled-coil domain containing 117 [Mus musculus]EDL40535.1 coiled-coil domain containing 117 [Mus musculus]|eukprot:NP_598794.2 coiled-coil domain-containing protein 117 [Mus musculus]
MAALGRPFSGLPLSGSADFLQPPPAFAGRAFPPGAAGHDLAPRPGVRGAPSSPGGRTARGRVSIHCRKKHKRLAEDDECPVRKKRLTEAELGAVTDEWALGAHQGREGHGVNTCPSSLSMPSMLDVVCEEMDQTTGEPQCEVARRRLQEIEDRIIDEDEEVESDRNVSHLPSLVLSDTMKTGLKREFDEVFTKRMIESMSRPSMELVLWKPLPELLPEKPKPSSSPKNYRRESQAKHAAPGTAFPQRTEGLLEPQCADAPLYRSLEAATSTEEEMEL